MAAAKGNDYTLNRKKNPQHTKEEINKIIEELLEWAHRGEGIWLESYIYETYKKAPSWFHDLGQHHPEMKDAIKFAKELIGGKVANHCWIGDRNSSFGEKILPMYSSKYKEKKEWEAALAKIADNTIQVSFSELSKAAEEGTLLDLLKQKDDVK